MKRIYERATLFLKGHSGIGCIFFLAFLLFGYKPIFIVLIKFTVSIFNVSYDLAIGAVALVFGYLTLFISVGLFYGKGFKLWVRPYCYVMTLFSLFAVIYGYSIFYGIYGFYDPVLLSTGELINFYIEVSRIKSSDVSKAALYFSTVVFTSLGFGDITPSLESRQFVIYQTFTGYFYLGFLISMVISLYKDEHRVLEKIRIKVRA